MAVGGGAAVRSRGRSGAQAKTGERAAHHRQGHTLRGSFSCSQADAGPDKRPVCQRARKGHRNSTPPDGFISICAVNAKSSSSVAAILPAGNCPSALHLIWR